MRVVRFIPGFIEQNKEEQAKYRWQTLGVLLALFAVAATANLPHARAVKTLAYQAGETDALILSPILESIIFTAGIGLVLGTVFIWIGLWLSARANLGAPLLVRWLSGIALSNLVERKVVITSILLGGLVGALMLVQLELQESILPMGEAKFHHPSALPNLFAAFSAGVTEEIMFRLGLVSLVVALLQFLTKTETPSNLIVWSGILVVGLVFGLTHLPVAGTYYELTPVVVGTIVMGNVVTGTAFGWVFWRYGLIMAMLAHFSFDVVFHVLGSPFG